MKSEKQIEIARGAAFFLIFCLILGVGISLKVDIAYKSGDISYVAVLLLMVLYFISLSPFFALCSVFAWSLKHRKQKTALILFVLLAIWLIGTSIIFAIPTPNSTIVDYLLFVIIPMIVVMLLLQGVVALYKSQAVSSAQ